MTKVRYHPSNSRFIIHNIFMHIQLKDLPLKAWKRELGDSQELGIWQYGFNMHARILYGLRTEDCEECGVPYGLYHLIGCTKEVCPQCEGFIALCGCHVCPLDDICDIEGHSPEVSYRGRIQ